MNRRWIQDLLVVLIVVMMLIAQSFSYDEPEVIVVIEKAKQTSLADAKFDELYRQGKYMTSFGDNR